MFNFSRGSEMGTGYHNVTRVLTILGRVGVLNVVGEDYFPRAAFGGRVADIVVYPVRVRNTELVKALLRSGIPGARDSLGIWGEHTIRITDEPGQKAKRESTEIYIRDTEGEAGEIFEYLQKIRRQSEGGD